MKALELIEEARSLGLSLRVTDENKLKIYPGIEGIPGEFLAKLKASKQDIIQFISNTDVAASARPIPTLIKNVDGRSPLTHAQLRLWLSEQGMKSQHLIRAVFELKGSLDKSKLANVLSETIKQERVFRVTICEDSDGVNQVVRDFSELTEYFEEISCDSVDIETVINAQFSQEFDLSKSLLKFFLIEVSPKHYFLLLKAHHLILDGVSLGVLFKKISKAYNQGISDFYKQQFDYLDFSTWEHCSNADQYYEPQVNYWLKKLKGFDALNLPKIVNDNVSQHCAGSLQKTFDSSLLKRLRTHSIENKVTLNTVFLAALYIVLAHYTSKQDLILGVPTSNRFFGELEDSIGFYMNNLPLRLNLENQTTKTILALVQENLLSLQNYSNAPFDMIFEKLEPAQKQQDPFEVIFNYIEGQNKALTLSDVEVAPVFSKAVTIPNLLNIAIKINQGVGELNIDYDRSYFDQASVERFHQHYLNALEALLVQDLPIKELNQLTSGEQDLIFRQWNKTEKQYNTDVLPDRLLESFELYADQTAIVSDDRTISYSQLGCMSKSIAAALQNSAVSKGDFIAVSMERSVERTAVLYGIALAGAAYIPIDVNMPEERVSSILEDAQPKLLIADTKESSALKQNNDITVLSAVDLLDFDEGKFKKVTISSEDPAYIIYTSGSTGKPKGVLIQQQGIVNRLEWMQEAYNLGSNDRVIQKTPYAFDVSVWEFFWPVLYGAGIVVPKENGHKDPEYLFEQINKHKVTTIHFVPSMLSVFLDTVSIKACQSLKRIICSGEALQRKDVNFVLENSNIKVHNLYGPTEASIDVTYHECEVREDFQPVPIGMPISNIRTYILDKNLNPVPIGIPGELYLSGVGLAKGYVNRPKMTQERFIPNPFTKEPLYNRMYKTGDLVKWGEDGQIYYLGRLDHQVKLRGLRIELGEIENAMASCPGVTNCLVLLKVINNMKHLVGYYAGHDVQIDKIKAHLEKILPEYMMPSYFIYLDDFPMNQNGKADRKIIDAMPVKLPSVKRKSISLPSTEKEKKIALAWQKVLGITETDVNDNFFHLGGDSISLMQVMVLIRKNGLTLPAKVFFETPILKELAKLAVAKDDNPHVVAPVKGGQKITSIQHWFFEGTENVNFCNQLFRLKSNQNLNIKILRDAIEYVTSYHDVFSLKFRCSNGDWDAYYQSDNNFIFKSHDLSQMTPAEQIKALETLGQKYNGALDIVHGPLAAFIHFKLSENDERVLVIVNHLIVDGVSWRILIEDLSHLYKALTDNLNPQAIFEKSTSYQDWGLQEQSVPIASDVKTYWKNLANKTYDTLPVDYCSGPNSHGSSKKYRMTLNKKLTRELLTVAVKNLDVHINAILISPLAFALEKFYQLEKVLIDLESHGRASYEGNVDLTRTVGWFTSIYPIALECTQSDNLANSVESIDLMLKAVPNNGQDFLRLKYGTEFKQFLDDVQADISFNYLGQFSDNIFQDTLFEMAEEYYGEPVAPENKRRHKLSIVAVVADDELRIDWNYSANQFDEKTIKALAEQYMNFLENVMTLKLERVV